MIVKERTVPIRIQKLEALIRRLPKNHPKRLQLEKELKSRYAGFNGEKALDFYLNKLPEREFFILHGLRLRGSGEYYFQIDTLILTSRLALVIEVKNVNGTLYFDNIFNQMIQITADDEQKGYAHPVEQVTQQKRELEKWMQKRKIQLPADFLVVISKPSTILKTDQHSTSINKKLIHAQYLLSHVNQLNNTTPLLSEKEVKHAAKLLNKHHTEEVFNVFASYQVGETQILRGVQCPACAEIPMKRSYGSWHCPYCGCKDKNAHEQTVKDFFLLFQEEPLTNSNFRKFTCLNSSYTARRMLATLSLTPDGHKKARKYLPLI